MMLLYIGVITILKVIIAIFEKFLIHGHHKLVMLFCRPYIYGDLLNWDTYGSFELMTD